MSQRHPLRATGVLIAALVLFPIASHSAEDPLRLGHRVEPTSEQLRLILDADRPDYSGTARIALRVNEATRGFRFHARELTLDAAKLSRKGGAVRLTITKPRADMVEANAAAALAPGDYTLTLQFHNRFNTRAAALYRVQTGGHGYLFSQFESTEAREAFPCWDEPEFKIPWDITLVVPAKHLAIANTPIVRETPADSGRKTVVFKRTRPLPSYLIALAAGPLETVDVPGMSVPGRIVTVQGASALAGEAARMTPPILKALETYFGRPYPYEKLDQIAAPEFLYGAMENAGAIVYADRALLADPATVSPAQRDHMAGIIAHEIAHMWFGDLVTMRWWDDLWLNESFADWMATRVEDQVFPEFRQGVQSIQGAQFAMSTDAELSTRAIRQPVTAADNLDQLADELAYNKGQAVLDMFEGWLGADAFRAGVLEYLKAHEWGTATGSDLWQALSKAAGENIDASMASFLDQGGLPLVSAELLPGGKVRLAQRRFLGYGVSEAAPTRWRIPVMLEYANGLGKATKKVWLTDSTTVVDLGTQASPSWIYPNAGAWGYYRWQVDLPMLTELARRASVTLTPRERVAYVLDLGALLRGGQIHGDDFLSLLRNFSDETDPQVVGAVLRVLGEIRDPLVNEEAAPAFAGYLGAVLGPALDRIGRLPRAGEPLGVTLMRPDLLRMMADPGRNAAVIAFADSLGAAHRKDPASVDASLAETAVLLPALHGDRALFDEYRRGFETAKIPTERSLYLRALGGFRDTAVVAEALRYSLTGPLRPQEIFAIPRVVGAREENRDRLLAFTTRAFGAMATHVPPHFLVRMGWMGGGCSAERLETARAFFLDPSRKVQGMEQEMDKVADRVRECLSLAKRDGPRATAYLRSFAMGQ